MGCGTILRNPYHCSDVWGIDINQTDNNKIKTADLAIESIPFSDNFFDYVTAFDFIEHIPRIIYNPNRRYPFIELMNEIYRVLKPGGIFLSFTPAVPCTAAFGDPTHVNFITEDTFPYYFCGKPCYGAHYGFNGNFMLLNQRWDKISLVTELVKVI